MVKLGLLKVDKHIAGKWYIHHTKQLQSLGLRY